MRFLYGQPRYGNEDTADQDNEDKPGQDVIIVVTRIIPFRNDNILPLLLLSFNDGGCLDRRHSLLCEEGMMMMMMMWKKKEEIEEERIMLFLLLLLLANIWIIHRIWSRTNKARSLHREAIIKGSLRSPLSSTAITDAPALKSSIDALNQLMLMTQQKTLSALQAAEWERRVQATLQTIQEVAQSIVVASQTSDQSGSVLPREVVAVSGLVALASSILQRKLDFDVSIAQCELKARNIQDLDAAIAAELRRTDLTPEGLGRFSQDTQMQFHRLMT